MLYFSLFAYVTKQCDQLAAWMTTTMNIGKVGIHNCSKWEEPGGV